MRCTLGIAEISEIAPLWVLYVCVFACVRVWFAFNRILLQSQTYEVYEEWAHKVAPEVAVKLAEELRQVLNSEDRPLAWVIRVFSQYVVSEAFRADLRTYTAFVERTLVYSKIRTCVNYAIGKSFLL